MSLERRISVLPPRPRIQLLVLVLLWYGLDESCQPARFLVQEILTFQNHTVGHRKMATNMLRNSSAGQLSVRYCAARRNKGGENNGLEIPSYSKPQFRHLSRNMPVY